MLTLQEGTILVKPTDLLLASFMEAYAQDKSENKEEANKLFCYIHLRSQVDPEAPFFRAQFNEIDAISRQQVYKDPEYNWSDSIYTELQARQMVTEYMESLSTPADRALLSYDKKIDQFNILLDETDPILTENEVKGKTTFVSNTPLLSKMMMDMEKLMDARDNLVLKMKKQAEKGRVRGDATPSLLEDQHDG
jgi:hypothetical protein